MVIGIALSSLKLSTVPINKNLFIF
ncbi:MAG: hypothetical protein FD546_000308 [Pelagibacterales bacterium]|nr:hypothetical protein [Pelagibacterales bacterium]